MLSKCSAAAAAVCAELDLGTLINVTGGRAILQPCGEAMTAIRRLMIVEALLVQRAAELPTRSASACTC